MEYDYDAVHDDELTIRVGEVIRNVRKLQEEGWLEGELNGRRGMFPDNFVKVSIFSLMSCFRFTELSMYVKKYIHVQNDNTLKCLFLTFRKTQVQIHL